MSWFGQIKSWWTQRWSPQIATARRIVIISDLHLGEEVGEGDQPYLDLIKQGNQALSSFIVRLCDDADAPLTLVINGDSIDFLRTILHPNPIEARLIHARPLTPREARLGKDSSREHAVWKLGRVVGYHRPVMEALARLLAKGHEVVIVRGNHDVELYWPEVREAIVDALRDMAGHVDASFAQRLRFEPWFYLAAGRVYVEHGHQYDPHCSYQDLLDPVDDEGQSLAIPYVTWSVRYFAPLLHGAPAAEMEEWSFFDFVRFGLRQPPARVVRAVAAYVRLIIDVFARKSWRHTVGRPSIRARHRRRLERLAAEADLPLPIVRRLDAIKETPVSERFLGIALAFYIDRFLLLLLTSLGLGLAAVLPLSWLARGVMVLVVMLLAIVSHEVLRRLRNAEAAPHFEEKAWLIARLLDVPFVSFGHSHEAGLHPDPSDDDDAAQRFYFNSGHWVARYAATAFTYVDIDGPEDAPRARLLRWNGPHAAIETLAEATPGAPARGVGLARPRSPEAEMQKDAAASSDSEFLIDRVS